MYKVIEPFVDLQDDHHRYAMGDIFPRSGHDVSEERINELCTGKNRRNKVLIIAIEEPKKADKEPEKVIEPAVEEEKPVKPKRGRKKKDA